MATGTTHHSDRTAADGPTVVLSPGLILRIFYEAVAVGVVAAAWCDDIAYSFFPDDIVAPIAVSDTRLVALTGQKAASALSGVN